MQGPLLAALPRCDLCLPGDRRISAGWATALVPSQPLEGLLDAHCLARDYEKAIEAFMRWRDPPPHVYAELAACYAQAERMDDARAALAEFQRLRPDGYDFAQVARVQGQMCGRPEDRHHWLEGYRKAGLEV